MCKHHLSKWQSENNHYDFLIQIIHALSAYLSNNILV